MTWECSKCGACCRNIVVYAILPNFWDEKNLKCKYLSKNNLCKIYSTRPSICRITEVEKTNPLLTKVCEILRKMAYGVDITARSTLLLGKNRE